MPRSMVSLRITQELVGELDKLAGDCKTSRSRLIEKILTKFFEQDRITQNAAIGRKEALPGV